MATETGSARSQLIIFAVHVQEWPESLSDVPASWSDGSPQHPCAWPRPSQSEAASAGELHSVHAQNRSHADVTEATRNRHRNMSWNAFTFLLPID